MSGLLDPGLIAALVLAGSNVMRRSRKRKRRAMLVAANQLPERQRTAIHVRIHREPMQWAARLASLSERQFKRRYRMPKHAFAQLVNDLALPLFTRPPVHIGRSGTNSGQ
jgi:hypothetical protein